MIGIVPSGRTLLLLGLATPLFLAGWTLGLAWDAAILALALADGRRTRAPGASRIPPRISTLAAVSKVEVALSNPTNRTLTVRVVDDLDPCLRRKSGPDGEDPENGARVRIPPKTNARWTYRIVPRTRGFLKLGDIHLRTRSPWGLAWRRSRVAASHVLQVQPGIRDLLKDRRAHALRQLKTPGRRRARLRGEGREFESLRDYVRGDDPRTIDWKGSARRTELVVRTYEAERSQSVVLAIDAGRHMRERLSPTRERIDFALGACMMLSSRAQRFGDKIGVMVFDRDIRHLSPPRRADPPTLAKVLAGVETKLAEPNYPLAFATLGRTFRKRSLVILFCDVIDDTVSQALVSSLSRVGRTHLPLAIAIRNPELEAAASRSAAGADVYRRAAAEELLQARSNTLRTMQRSGIVVVDTLPGDAMVRTLDKYVEIKERGLL